ncbi:MAG: hypothetical protein ABIQ32_00135 [Sphingomicrobium sp.]
MRPLFCVLAVVAGVLGLASCGFTSGETYRYRITVEVDTPQGVRSGSSVWETRSWEGSGIPDRGIRSRNRGEAVAVDLPGGTLFALLRAQDMNVNYVDGLVPGHLDAHPQPGAEVVRDWKERQRLIVKTRPAFELSPDEYPLLVRFRDINNPASVEKVTPGDLEASFGPGVRLKRIMVAVTDDGVTTGIATRLPWLDHLEKYRRTPDNPFTSRLPTEIGSLRQKD